MLNIGFGSQNPIEKKLSNFAPLVFTFDGVTCACLEGPLQAFKSKDVDEQIRICQLDGRSAKRAGRAYNNWKKSQTLHWQGVAYHRSSKAYQALLNRLYTVAFEASADFRQTLLESGRMPLSLLARTTRTTPS